jgi:hypothetical protein
MNWQYKTYPPDGSSDRYVCYKVLLAIQEAGLTPVLKIVYRLPFFAGWAQVIDVTILLIVYRQVTSVQFTDLQMRFLAGGNKRP